MPFDFASPEFPSVPSARHQRGLANYHAGLAAETSVELDYVAGGAALLERRWRGKAGEVDIILQDGEDLVFVEVKKSKCFARAAQSLSARQLARICRASEEYIGALETGSLTPMRIDLAMVNEAGEVEILRNVSGF